MNVSTARAWWMAARPRTLTAGIAPVAVGSAVAASAGRFALGPAVAALVGALLIQVATNLANDLFDAEKGADTPDRLGPTRVVQAGLLPPAAVRAAMIGTFGFAALVGCYLVGVGGWPVVAIGVASIVSGIAYTGGPWPLGYHGLGDLFVFVFFGLVAVAGTVWVQALAIPDGTWPAAVAVGAISTAVLVVNNVRDLETDRRAGKRTLAVRLGRRASVAEYGILLSVAYAVPAGVFLAGGSWGWLLPCLTLPEAASLARRISRAEGRLLNPLLGRTARLLGLHGLLLASGIAWG